MRTHSKAPNDNARMIRDLDRFADWMDSRFQIPGTGIRFGLDSLLGLIPGVGDTVTAAATLYIVAQARAAGAPKTMQARMLWNVFIDWLIGLVPLIGDIFDIGWKANRKNVALLKRHLNG